MAVCECKHRIDWVSGGWSHTIYNVEGVAVPTFDKCLKQCDCKKAIRKKGKIKLDSIVIIFGDSARDEQIKDIELRLSKLLIGKDVPITSVFWEKGE